MRWNKLEDEACSLARTVSVIGDRWTLLILRSAMYGVRRFDDFQAELDVPRSVLSARLAALVDAGIMEKRDYREEGQRARVEYPLTRMGSQLGLPFFAMTEWGDRWLSEGEPHFGLRSCANGQKLRVMLVDERGKAVKPQDIQYVVDDKVWPPETHDQEPARTRRRSG